MASLMQAMRGHGVRSLRPAVNTALPSHGPSSFGSAAARRFVVTIPQVLSNADPLVVECQHSSKPLQHPADVIVVGIASQDGKLHFEHPDAQFVASVKEVAEVHSFTGKANAFALEQMPATHTGRGLALALVGLGDGTGRVDPGDVWRRAGGRVIRLARERRATTAAFVLPTGEKEAAQDGLGPAGLVTEGALLSAHAPLCLKKDSRQRAIAEAASPADSPTRLERLTLLCADEDLTGATEAISRQTKVCKGVNFARNLVDAPANIMNPTGLAETASAIAASAGTMHLEVLEQEQCEKLGMGCFLGVSQGSDSPPKFIHLKYTPAGTPVSKLCVIGKGVTFDTGGYNLKVAGSSIELMKMDMGGSAAALGAAHAISLLQPAGVEVHFIVAACENMINGKAVRPGDVIEASNGKTVEVNNTDAEGRLTLADALVYAESVVEPDAMVDLATLTGACMVALGKGVAGVWSKDATLGDSLYARSQRTGESLWPMPMVESYRDGLKSQIADYKNCGPRDGGAITAALFLDEFVERTPHAHIDIAGPAWLDAEGPYMSKGATGFGVRTVVAWVDAEARART